jgi:hypothetical protein
MPDFSKGRKKLGLLPWTLVLIAVLPACGGQSKQPSQSEPSGHGRTSPPLIAGRSAKPTDLDAPGIQIPIGSTLIVSIEKYNLKITGNDWNTIAGSSRVAKLVGMEFAPDFNATKAVTRNRFQYLADEISQHYDGTRFEPLSIVSGASNRAVVDIAGLYNPSARASELTALTVTITNNSSKATVASGTFYSPPNSAIVIPARTVYFARLTFSSSSLGPAVNGQRNTTIHFHYKEVALCSGQACS